MGISSFDTAAKRRVIVNSIIHKPSSKVLTQYKVVSVDFCAAFRKAVSPTVPVTVTPRVAVAIFLKWLRPLIRGAEAVIICVDLPGHIPERRHAFYKNKLRPYNGGPVPDGYVVADAADGISKVSERHVTVWVITLYTEHLKPNGGLGYDCVWFYR